MTSSSHYLLLKQSHQDIPVGSFHENFKHLWSKLWTTSKTPAWLGGFCFVLFPLPAPESVGLVHGSVLFCSWSFSVVPFLLSTDFRAIPAAQWGLEVQLVTRCSFILPTWERINCLWLWFPCPKKPGEVPGNLKMFYVYESFKGSTVSGTLIWYLQMMPKSVLFGPSWRGRCVRCAWCEPQRCCSHGT